MFSAVAPSDRDAQQSKHAHIPSRLSPPSVFLSKHGDRQCRILRGRPHLLPACSHLRSSQPAPAWPNPHQEQMLRREDPLPHCGGPLVPDGLLPPREQERSASADPTDGSNGETRRALLLAARPWRKLAVPVSSRAFWQPASKSSHTPELAVCLLDSQQ